MPWSAVAAEAPPENVAPLSGDPLLTLERELVSAERGFPCLPGLVCAWEAIPVGSVLLETVRGEERAGGYGREPFVIDGQRRSY